jgi:hypothetical protein
MNLQQEYIDKIAKNLTDTIDAQVLYKARGWTIVQVPNLFMHHDSQDVINWINTHCGEYQLWWGVGVAFKESKDATLFLLKWS